jgi:leader peptidase (prepilin peptidase)/N-methyltransferase
MPAISDLSPGFLGAVALAFGLVTGSFLNVVIYRLPRGESLVLPGSHCPRCHHAVAPWDNVPVLSYLWLGGRCRHCHARISLRYPAIELLTGLLFLGIALRYGATAMMPVWFAFTAALVAAAAIDFDHRIIPDEISVGGLALAAVVVPAVQALTGTPLASAVLHVLGGALLGGGVIWTVGFVHARVSTALGRRFEHWPGEGEAPPVPGSLDYWTWFPGVGFGDVKLLAMIGAVLGPVGALKTILVASLAGLVLGVGWAAVTRSWNAPFGFGPAIAVGAVLVVLAPPHLALPF